MLADMTAESFHEYRPLFARFVQSLRVPFLGSCRSAHGVFQFLLVNGGGLADRVANLLDERLSLRARLRLVEHGTPSHVVYPP